jgi:hypothetical protein
VHWRTSTISCTLRCTTSGHRLSMDRLRHLRTRQVWRSAAGRLVGCWLAGWQAAGWRAVNQDKCLSAGPGGLGAVGAGGRLSQPLKSVVICLHGFPAGLPLATAAAAAAAAASIVCTHPICTSRASCFPLAEEGKAAAAAEAEAVPAGVPDFWMTALRNAMEEETVRGLRPGSDTGTLAAHGASCPCSCRCCT